VNLYISFYGRNFVHKIPFLTDFYGLAAIFRISSCHLDIHVLLSFNSHETILPFPNKEAVTNVLL
jgi:hypothetical protein